MHDGSGRTSGKVQNIIMVRAIARYNPLVTRNDMDGFSTLEGLFAPKGNVVGGWKIPGSSVRCLRQRFCRNQSMSMGILTVT